MKKLLLSTAMAFMAVAAHAQTLDLGALQKQLSASPAGQQAQQLMMQQAMQQMAANPQLLSNMASSLTPQQQATLMTQAMAVGQQLFTKQEQAKLAAFTSSPEGASIAAKLPQLVQQLAPTVLQMLAAQNAGVTPAAGK